jgi:SAM-dependent methyltransferase
MAAVFSFGLATNRIATQFAWIVTDGHLPAPETRIRELFFVSHPNAARKTASESMQMSTGDPFFEPYDRDEIAYGDVPSAALNAFLEQTVNCSGKVLDLGAGAGRDTIALARAGFHVTAVDLSARGLERVMQRAIDAGLEDRVKVQVADVRELEMSKSVYTAIVATTVLDHIPASHAIEVWKRMTAAITDDGFLFVEVHSTEDPGSDQLPGKDSNAPVSETAGAVINYFAPNQLARWASEPRAALRVLRYEERQEWDYTHGPEHLHGKQILLAVRQGSYPRWFGQPAAFPRKS